MCNSCVITHGKLPKQMDNPGRDANPRKFDPVAAWSHLGRSLPHLLEFLAELQPPDLDLYLHQQGIDTTTPAGTAMFRMCGVFAEIERSIIRERIDAELARARANGKRPGRPSVGAEVEEAIREALRGGDKGIRKIAREMGTGVSVVQRVKLESTASMT